jgi:lysophospholipase L1-like esterase
VLVVPVSGVARADTRLVAYGDSYVKPSVSGARHGQRPWVDLLGQPVVNRGHAADDVRRTLDIVRDTGAAARGDVVVEVGINDVRSGGDDPIHLAAFRIRYGELLDRLGQAHRVVVVPPLPITWWGTHGSLPALEAFRAVVLEVSRDHLNVRVADPYLAWRTSTMLMPDGLHPNAAGRQLLAETVRTALG